MKTTRIEDETWERPEPAPAAAAQPLNPPRRDGVLSRLPGLGVAVAIAAFATLVGRLAPVVGGPVVAVVTGVLLSSVLRSATSLRPGTAFAGRVVLQVSVVLLGSQLSLSQVVHVGVESLPVMVGTLTVCLAAAWWLGRRLGVQGNLTTLVGVGTGICGASAIAAVTPVIGAVGLEVVYAISTIFLFNVAAVILFPILGHLLGLSQHAFGLLAGTAINDTSSVVAAGYTYGTAAGSYAVVVKLTRTLLIIPICLFLARRQARRSVSARVPAGTAQASGVKAHRLVPWFLLGFLLLAAANTAGLVPVAAHQGLSQTSVFLITVALAAIGLSTDLAGLRRTGPRPLVLGACLWAVVTVSSLLLQLATGTL